MYIYIYICIYTAIPKLKGNKSKIYNEFTHKKEKRIKHNTEDRHQIIREQKRKREKKDLLKQIQNNKIRTLITIITLNVN